MSLILDALNRSRTEQGSVPNIETQHGGEAAPASGRRWPLLLALAVALLVIIGLLLDRIVDERSTPAPAVLPEPAMASLPQVQPAPEPKPQTQPEPRSQPQPEVAPARPAVISAAQKPAASEASAQVSALYAQQEVAPEPAQAPPPRPSRQVQAAPKAEPAPAPSPAPAVAEQPVDIEAMLRQAEAELENARLEEHPAPFLESLSQQAKDGIPTIYYQRHDYSGKAGQSRVTLNSQELAKGGRANGLRVNEILSDSVVLTYNGTTFRLRALNSWVNL